MAQMALLDLREDVEPALHTGAGPFGYFIAGAQAAHAVALRAFQRANANAG